MTNLIDKYLLFRIRTKRDPEAFAKLYDRYVMAIFRFVFLKLPSREAAEDVTSEAFLRCWQWIQQNREISNFRALLYRIARNLVADNYRKTKENFSLDAQVVTETEFATSTIVLGDIADGRQGQKVIEARAELSLVIQRVAKLKEDYQDVVTLRLVDGLDFGDIAQVLEKTPGHVRVIYHRAMKTLQKMGDGGTKTT